MFQIRFGNILLNFIAEPALKQIHVIASGQNLDDSVRTEEERGEINARTGAIAVDMESFEVARICRERKIGFMAIRAISDTFAEDLPREVLAIFGPKGTVRAGALAGTLVKRPSSIKDLWRIRDNAVFAAKSLAKFTLEVIPQLAADEGRGTRDEGRGTRDEGLGARG